MKIGIIIVIDANHQDLLITEISKVLKNSEDIIFCLVNNSCSEFMSDKLLELSEEHENVNVIHVKKRKENSWAVRAGSRFMNNHFKLKFIGYISDLKDKELVHAIEVFIEHHKEITEDHSNYRMDKLVKQTFFQRIFSVNNFYRQGNFKLKAN